MLLALDTSTRYGGVALTHEDRVVASHTWYSRYNHTAELMPAVVHILERGGLAATDLDGVAVALGPGGFSAVRVGISTALGLAVSKKLPVLGVPTHDIEVEPFLELITREAPVYSLIPAGRGEISWARHSVAPDGVDLDVHTGLGAPEELLNGLEPDALLRGEACDLMVGLVEKSRFMKGGQISLRDPNSLLNIATEKFGAGVTTPYEELRPIYARPPSISQPRPAH